FDLCVEYERFTTDPKATIRELKDMGLNLPANSASFPRSPEAIVEHARSINEWANPNFRVRWGLGGAKIDPGEPLRPLSPQRIDTAEELAREYSPNLYAHYYPDSCQ
ncbi:MAG: hypothetical protein ACRDKE_03555, partial [Solirubrobacterales bacterium]